MPSTQQSAQAVSGPATLRFELRMKHGHGAGWRPSEIYAFADSIVKDALPLVKLAQLDSIDAITEELAARGDGRHDLVELIVTNEIRSDSRFLAAGL